MVGWIYFSRCGEIYPCSANYCGNPLPIAVYWGRILNMDDTQQKAQIDEDARKAKEQVDIDTAKARQILADEEAAKIRSDAEAEIALIQSNAQK